jgi:hypothetical protein
VGVSSTTQLDLNRAIVSGNQAATGPEIFNYQHNFTEITSTISTSSASTTTPASSASLPALPTSSPPRA